LKFFITGNANTAHSDIFHPNSSSGYNVLLKSTVRIIGGGLT
jgi:hypothetical protein